MCSHSISGGSCSLPFQSLTCPQAQAAAACSLCTAARMIWAQPFLLLRRPVLLSLLIHHSLLCSRLRFKWPNNANFCSVAVDWLFSRHVHYSNLSFVPYLGFYCCYGERNKIFFPKNVLPGHKILDTVMQKALRRAILSVSYLAELSPTLNDAGSLEELCAVRQDLSS